MLGSFYIHRSRLLQRPIRKLKVMKKGRCQKHLPLYGRIPLKGFDTSPIREGFCVSSEVQRTYSFKI